MRLLMATAIVTLIEINHHTLIRLMINGARLFILHYDTLQFYHELTHTIFGSVLSLLNLATCDNSIVFKVELSSLV
jgi:hypothetical protein